MPNAFNNAQCRPPKVKNASVPLSPPINSPVWLVWTKILESLESAQTHTWRQPPLLNLLLLFPKKRSWSGCWCIYRVDDIVSKLETQFWLLFTLRRFAQSRTFFSFFLAGVSKIKCFPKRGHSSENRNRSQVQDLGLRSMPELTTGTEEIERSHVLTEFLKLVCQDDWLKEWRCSKFQLIVCLFVPCCFIQ